MVRRRVCEKQISFFNPNPQNKTKGRGKKEKKIKELLKIKITKALRICNFLQMPRFDLLVLLTVFEM